MWQELDVSDWFTEIERGLDYRSKYAIEPKWAELHALFYGVHNSQASAGPNIIMATGDSMLSALCVPYPHWTVKARDQRSIAKARVVESLDNEFIDSLGIPAEVETSLLHTFLWGKGILKIGYDSEYGWDERLDLGRLVGQELGMSLSQHDRKGWRIEFNKVKPGFPWVQSVMPHDFVVPWGTPRDLERAPWCVHRIVRHIDEIKSDGKYENTSGLKPVMSMQDFVRSYQSTLRPYRMGSTIEVVNKYGEGAAEYCELWEIHDKRTGKVMVVATGHDKFLRNDTDALQVDGGLPFVAMNLIPSSHTFWVTPDAYFLRQAQAELSDITLQSQKQRRVSVLRFLYNRSLITDDELQRALSSGVGAGIPIDDPGQRPLSEVIQFFQPPGNVLLYQEAENTRRNVREQIGMSSNQSGEYEAKGRRTASEAMIVDKASMQRMSRRQVAVRNLYTDLFKKVNELVFEFWKTPRTSQVLDQRSQALWVTYTGEELKADYVYQLAFTNEPPESLPQRRMNAIQLYAQMAQDPTVDPVALRRYLANAINDPEFSSIFKPGVLDGSVPPEAYVQQAEGEGGGGPASSQSGGSITGPGPQQALLG